jgi:hypothetical protein
MSEGRRCAGHYRKSGSLPTPHELLPVAPGEVVILAGVVDFQRERPAWRLYMISDVMDGLCRALDWQDSFQVCDMYEARCRETAWGALAFAVSHPAPMSVARVSLRLRAVLRFWDSLQHARYLFDSPSALLTLDELMVAACGWAMTAWCPEGEGPVRPRLDTAAERMGRATKEDSIEAILRQVPRCLPLAHGLKHQDVLSNPARWRERLATLDPASLEPMSAAWPARLLEHAYDWDRQLGAH